MILMMQSVRDGIDIVTIEQVSSIGLLLLIVAILLYAVWSLQNSIKDLRIAHKLEIDELTQKHEAKLKEINDAMMAELRNSANAYKEQSETLKLVMKSQK